MIPERSLLWNCFVWILFLLLITVFMKVLNKLRRCAFLQHSFAYFLIIFAWYYNKIMYSRKKELFASLKEHLQHLDGDLLEIGAGTGANFHFYPNGCSVVVLEPNEYLTEYLVHSKNYYPNIDLKEYIVASAEDMSKLKDHSVSVVVTTLVLCSVESVEESLKEVIRVLKPGGRYYFLEHVQGKSWIFRFQQIVNPCWYYITDGCRLTRDIESHIRKAGFKNVQCEGFDANQMFPPVVKPHIMGFAEM